MAAQPWEVVGPGLADARQQVEPGHRGEGRTHERRHPHPGRTRHGFVQHGQAPSIIWPQTRTTLPLRAVEPGLANHATVSATSTGSPPWLIALSRRPTSRVANGTAAVIWVSMNPGATAFT